jgi:hypothetical protein
MNATNYYHYEHMIFLSETRQADGFYKSIKVMNTLNSASVDVQMNTKPIYSLDLEMSKCKKESFDKALKDVMEVIKNI